MWPSPRRVDDWTPLSAPRDLASAGPDELAWRELLHDELRSLRRRTALLAGVAVVALGIAVVALLSDDSVAERRGGASAARAAALERRLDDIRAAVERAPSSGEVVSLRGRQRALEQQLAALADALERAGEAAAELRLLERRVEALERRGPAPTPTPTVTP
jgi:uncharacterized protein involved in exopolysaccharide biosynthesis